MSLPWWKVEFGVADCKAAAPSLCGEVQGHQSSLWTLGSQCVRDHPDLASQTKPAVAPRWYGFARYQSGKGIHHRWWQPGMDSLKHNVLVVGYILSNQLDNRDWFNQPWRLAGFRAHGFFDEKLHEPDGSAKSTDQAGPTWYSGDTTISQVLPDLYRIWLLKL
jgi:hypothetical protein